MPAQTPAELTQAVHDNLRNLGSRRARRRQPAHHVRRACGPPKDRSRRSSTALAELQQQGLIRHLGLSNVTAAQVAGGARIAEIVCVQNHYNLAHRDDDALIDDLARDGIAYVPFFPLGGFTPLQSDICRPSRGVWRRRRCRSRSPGCCAIAEHPADPRHIVALAPEGEPRGRRTYPGSDVDDRTQQHRCARSGVRLFDSRGLTECERAGRGCSHSHGMTPAGFASRRGRHAMPIRLWLGEGRAGSRSLRKVRARRAGTSTFARRSRRVGY